MLVVAILVLSIPITLQLVKTQQDLRQRASSVSLSDTNPATGNTYEQDLENNGAGAAVDFYQDNLGGSVPQNVVEALNHIDSSGQVPEEYGGNSGSGVNSQTETSSQSMTITNSGPTQNISSLNNTNLNQTFRDPTDGKVYQVTEQQKAALEAVAAISPSGTGVAGTPQYQAMTDAFVNGPKGECISNCGGTTAAPSAPVAAPKPAAAPSATPTTPGTPTVSTACAQFSQYCTVNASQGSSSCNWGNIRGTSSCTETVTSFYRTCLLSSGDLGPTIQAICGSGTTPPVTGSTTLALSVSIPGIGNAAGGNTNPKRKTRSTTITILDASDNTVNNVSADLTYDSASGNFTGNITPASAPQSYKIKAKLDNTIAKRPIQIFTGGSQSTAQAIQLVSGDLDQDNSISLADYNLMLSCTNSKSTCTSAIKDRADLNDDGTVDSADLAILYRGFQTRQGD